MQQAAGLNRHQSGSSAVFSIRHAAIARVALSSSKIYFHQLVSVSYNAVSRFQVSVSRPAAGRRQVSGSWQHHAAK